MLFFTPLAISLLAVVYSIYWVQKNFFAKVESIEISALSNKVQKASFDYLFKLYRMMAVVGLLFLIIIFSTPTLTLNTALGFLFGMVSAGVVGYMGLLFLLRLNLKVADSSYKGLIQSFYSVLDGSNILSVFILGFSLFVISVYFVSFVPTAKDLVALAIGASVVMAFSRIGVETYMQAVFGKKDIPKKDAHSNQEKQSRDPKVIAKLVGYSLEDGLSLPTTIFGIFTISTVGTALIAFSFLESAVGVLPLLIGGVGILSSFIGAKLARVGSTTNILKNITMFVGSTVLVASLLIFPLIIWLTSGGLQYSGIFIWLSVVMGFFSAGIIFLYYYFIKWKNIETAKAASIFSIIISGALIANFRLGGIYSMSLFSVSFISMAATVAALSVFSSTIKNAHRFSKIVDLPKERINTIDKLNLVSNVFRAGVNVYLWFGALAASLLLFFVYKQEITSRETYLDFALDNPVIVASLFLGGALIYWIVYYLSYFPKKKKNLFLYRIFKRSGEVKNELATDSKPDYTDHRLFVDNVAAPTYKETLFLFSIIFLSPIIISLIFGAEALSGFLMGCVLLGSFIAMQISFKNNKRGQVLRFGTGLEKKSHAKRPAYIYKLALVLHIAILSIMTSSVFLVLFLIR